MPNRLIKESALDSEDLSALSNGAERLFWRLIVVADDFGRFDGAPQVIKARCFPRLVDKLRTNEVENWMKELEPKLVRFYLVNGRPYGYFLNWLKHQQKRANASKFPDPPESEQLHDDSNCNHLQSNVLGIEIEIENRDRDRNRMPQKRPQYKTAYPDDFEISESVRRWCMSQHVGELAPHLDAFRDYHTAKGSRFLDWDAAFRNWIRNVGRFGGRGAAQARPAEPKGFAAIREVLKRENQS